VSLPCLILAAGFGTRMGDLTQARPKALIEVAGRPLIAHALEAAKAVQANPIAVNGHHLADMLRDWLAAHAPDVHFLHESPDILDSGGAVKNALGILGQGPIFTLNADAVWGGPAPLHGLARAWDADQMDGLLALVPLDAAVGRLGGGDFSWMHRAGSGGTKGPTGWSMSALRSSRQSASPTIRTHAFRFWKRGMT
jgi:MurNAc alpha-1-phosphate uridylyltransferase